MILCSQNHKKLLIEDEGKIKGEKKIRKEKRRSVKKTSTKVSAREESWFTWRRDVKRERGWLNVSAATSLKYDSPSVSTGGLNLFS